MHQTARNNAWVALFVIIFGVILVRTAWVADDALITFRTIDNFLNGYGLVWNVGERVQSYTHPLWLLVLTPVVAQTNELMLTSMIVSVLLSCATVVVLARYLATDMLAGLLALTLLLFSKAFIDFSTSGLENPLTHLLLVGFFVVYFGSIATDDHPMSWLFGLALLATLIALNRMDALLLVAPALAVGGVRSFWRHRDLRAGYVLVLAGLPFVLWVLFATFYYGFPLPNTAYAKLNTGIPSHDLYLQGAYYLLDSLNRDPLTLLGIGLGVAIPLATRQLWHLPIAVGIGLYVAYTIRIGGDFMSGRFLTAPLLLAAIVLARLPMAALQRLWLMAFTLLVLVGVGSPSAPIFSAANYPGTIPVPRMVIDERGFYYRYTGLLRLSEANRFPNLFYRSRGRHAQDLTTLSVFSAVGAYGLDAGPGTYVLDAMALSDALLARMPSFYNPNWRPGHFRRVVPDGYYATLESGTNQIEDPELAAYYDRIKLVIRGDLLDPQRLVAIWQLNTGQLNHLIDRERYRYPQMVRRELADIAPIYIEATSDARRRISAKGGLEVALGAPATAPQLEISIGRLCTFEVEYGRGGEVLARQRQPAKIYAAGATALHIIDVLPDVLAQGYDRLRLFPVRDSIGCEVGHVRLLGADSPFTPYLLLGQRWVNFDEPVRWTSSPAEVTIRTPTAQSALLHITPAYIFDPDQADDPLHGTRGTLEIAIGDDPVATVQIEANQTTSVPLHLQPGRQIVTMRLHAGNATIGTRKRSFAVHSIVLEPSQPTLPTR